MAWLNYHHLLYFWTVAREGTIARASKVLHLTEPTISAQVRTLERALGERLFRKSGRNLVLTDVGRVAFRYAEEIFTLGRELQDTLGGRGAGQRPARFVVGVADVVPKLIAHQLLRPALSLAEPVTLVCRDDAPERLLADLAVHALDLVISDAPVGPTVHVRAFNHLLGETGVTMFAVPELAERYRRGFPRSLDGAPVVLPAEHTVLRRALDQWFDDLGVRPDVRGQFSDSALMKVFGQAGMGVFPGPTVIEAEIRRQYAVRVVGRTTDVRESFYAISAERRIKHPAVLAIAEAARAKLFG